MHVKKCLILEKNNDPKIKHKNEVRKKYSKNMHDS